MAWLDDGGAYVPYCCRAAAHLPPDQPGEEDITTLVNRAEEQMRLNNPGRALDQGRNRCAFSSRYSSHTQLGNSADSCHKGGNSNTHSTWNSGNSGHGASWSGKGDSWSTNVRNGGCSWSGSSWNSSGGSNAGSWNGSSFSFAGGWSNRRPPRNTSSDIGGRRDGGWTPVAGSISSSSCRSACGASCRSAGSSSSCRSSAACSWSGAHTETDLTAMD